MISDINFKGKLFQPSKWKYKQVLGTAIGTKSAPTYVNFKAGLESITFKSDEYDPLFPPLFRRHFFCTKGNLYERKFLNSFYPTIKFTMEKSTVSITKDTDFKRFLKFLSK